MKKGSFLSLIVFPITNIKEGGAGKGNRTPICAMARRRTTIVRYPRNEKNERKNSLYPSINCEQKKKEPTYGSKKRNSRKSNEKRVQYKRSDCGIGTVVARGLPKPETRVRFSYPAPNISSMNTYSLIITAKNVKKNFGTFEAVRGITFDVPKGSMFAFLGPNGAGKTTTIKMLTTLLQPTSGTLEINGYDVQKDQAKVRQSFGIVFQDFSLDDELTAEENLEMHGVLYGVPATLRRERVAHLLDFVDLASRKHDLVKHFSGGMKRRLEIARSLVHHPTILFLDEPTVGLDPQTRNHLWEYIKKLSIDEGMTVFFTTHYMEEAAKYADQVAIIDHGQIIETGTPSMLIEKTKTLTLEDAFLSLTGHTIRDEDASSQDVMRQAQRMWRR